MKTVGVELAAALKTFARIWQKMASSFSFYFKVNVHFNTNQPFFCCCKNVQFVYA